MPALPSFITYRPGKKAKAAIKAPFSLLRGDRDNSAISSTTSDQQSIAKEVIDINSRSSYSLDFDGGNPSASFEQDVLHDPRSSQHNLNSPQVKLDIDLSNGLSDWLDAFSSADARQEAIASQIATLKRLSRLKNPASLDVKFGESTEGEGEANGGKDFASSSEDIVASLRAIDASHTGTLPERDDVLQGSFLPKRPTSGPITMQDGSPHNRPPDLLIGTRTPRPLSLQSDTTASSALSGTTLARALMSNSFILSADRSSKYRSGLGAGLTRSDSTTLPHGERNFSFHGDRFSIGADAPPIPSNAGFLYEPPRTSRNEEKPSKRDTRRRSSTGSLSPKLSPEIPSISSDRPSSVIVNADADFDSHAFLPQTPRVRPMPRLPLPPIPIPKQTIDEAMTSDQASTPDSFQEVTQQLPQDTQLLSPDFNALSPTPSSEGHTSAHELQGLLNYYSIPDSPELLKGGGGFRPMFSPISEELSSQLSPPVPFRGDRRDSQRSQPVGARSPRSGSLRVRGDSIISPNKDQSGGSQSQILPAEEGNQPNIAPVSPTTPSDSSFYFSGDDEFLTPPQLSKIFNRRRSGSAPSPISVVRNSRDIDAYNITMASCSVDAIPSQEDIVVSQEFPETPDAFSPTFSAGPNTSRAMTFQPGDGLAPMPIMSIPAAILELSHSTPAAKLLLNRTSVRHSRQGSISTIRSTTTARSGSPSRRIAESSEAKSSTSSPTVDDATTEEIPQVSSSEPSASQSSISLSMDSSRSSSRGPNIGQDASDGFSSIYASSIDMGSTSRTKLKCLPAIPMTSPIIPPSPDDETPTVPLPGTSTTPMVPAEPIFAPPSPLLPQTVKLSAPRGKLPPALTISKHTTVSGPGGPIAVNGSDLSGQNSPELELEQPQHDSPEVVTPALSNPFSTQGSLVHTDEAFRGRASDIFRGTSLGSPPPYYSVVTEALMQDKRSPNLSVLPSSSPHSQGPSAGSPSSNGNDRNLARENSSPGQRGRVRPPLPAGPRRPSQQLMSSPGPMRKGSFSSIASSSVLPDLRARPSVRHNPAPSPRFQAPTPKWRGFTMEVAKWTFTSAQLQAIVARAIRQSAESSSIRLLRLEVLDNDIPEEIQRLASQRTDIKMRYKTLTRRRATILDLLYSSLSVLEDGNSTHKLLRELDELKELTQTLDRLAEEIHSVDEQLSHLESLTHIHTSSALAIALRKLNSSFLKQVAENQVLRSKIQSLEAERDEAWQQAQDVANEYDQISENISSPTSKRSSRVSAVRKSTIRVSRAGLRTPSWRPNQRPSAGSGAPITGLTPARGRSPPPPLPRQRPVDIMVDSPVRCCAVLSSSGTTPSTEARALAQAQDELYAMLGIINPEHSLHRSRSESSPASPLPTSHFLSPRSGESPWMRRSSLPGALSLTEAYNVMAADRNAVLATIDMLSATE